LSSRLNAPKPQVPPGVAGDGVERRTGVAALLSATSDDGSRLERADRHMASEGEREREREMREERERRVDGGWRREQRVVVLWEFGGNVRIHCFARFANDRTAGHFRACAPRGFVWSLRSSASV